MANQRRNLERRHLIFYLSVYNDSDDRLMGYMVDISAGGLMLMSEQPLEPDQNLRLRVRLPEGNPHGKHFAFKAKSVWCRPGPRNNLYDIGFKLTEYPREVTEIISGIIAELGFGED